MNDLDSNPSVLAGLAGSPARTAARPALADRLCQSLVFRTPSGTRGNVSLSVKTDLGTSPAKVWTYL